MKNIFKMVPVRRTAYHKVILSFKVDETDNKIWVIKLLPDVGGVPKEGTFSLGPYADIAAARKAIRTAMSVKENLSLAFVDLQPSDYVKCILALDDWLHEIGEDFESPNVDINTLVLKTKCIFPKTDEELRKDYLVTELSVGSNTFSYTFGEIDWARFTLIK